MRCEMDTACIYIIFPTRQLAFHAVVTSRHDSLSQKQIMPKIRAFRLIRVQYGAMDMYT